ncbi:MAG: LysM peptidoglycan-binding domain-containing protein [Roseiflexaceae bacterium]|nr:LysM peptidoglycan-binding domain-containing protein [Roseiflexaceae bacterium]
MKNDSRAIASIKNKDKPGSQPIKCMFNPKEYSLSKQATWKEGETTAQNVPQLEFSGGKSQILTMQLFFDTYEAKGNKDVRLHTNKILELLMVEEKVKDRKNQKGHPPRVLFSWGSTWTFEAVITTIKQTFTLFLANGTPVRATLDVTFQEVKDIKEQPKQNPTSGGVGGERMYRVQAGDTLGLISFRELGDATLWRSIADANRLTNVRELTPGTVLVIPNE